MIIISVDDKEIQAEEGTSLLKVCLDNGIYIPNLCYMEGMETPPSSCRLCFVDIDGEKNPVPSCSVKVREGMKVFTNTPRVRGLQWSAFELIMSNHRIDCGSCLSRKACPLIKISRHLKIRLKPFRVGHINSGNEDIVEDHPCLIYDITKCVRCGKCLHICEKIHGRLYLTFAGRGVDMGISFFGDSDDETIPCARCLACVKICPVSALLSYERYEHSPEGSSS